MMKRMMLGLVMSCLTTYSPGQEPVPAVPSPAVSSRPTVPARPNPDAEGRYHIGDGVSPPKAVYERQPEFSELARKGKISGTCQVALVVGEDGKPRDVRVVKSAADGLPKKQQAAGHSMDERSVEAVKLYRFTPAMFQGRPVPVNITVEVNFQIF